MTLASYSPDKAHYIVVTAIIVKDGKYLITKRAATEKAFPNLWTVPGGKVETKDYLHRPKDTKDHWYNILEDVIAREVKEETNLEVKNISYVTSLVYLRNDGIPTLIISLAADYAGGNIQLCPALTDYAWITLKEARQYELIEGIYEELAILDAKRSGKEGMTWHKDL